eukprot:Em0003g1371a
MDHRRLQSQCHTDDNTSVAITIGSLNLNNFSLEKSTTYSTALAKLFGDESLKLDIIALQEIIKNTSESPMENIIDLMNSSSARCEWGYKQSEYAGLGGKGKEHFGLLWRTSKVKHHETLQLDLKKLRNTYTRRPSVDVLEIEEKKLLAVINVHLKYPGVPTEWKKHAKRLSAGENCCCHSCSRLKSEIKHLPMVAEIAKDQIKGKCITTILIGDFNLEPHHPWFTDLQKKHRPLNAQPTNFLKSLPRVYDNIWVEVGKAKGIPAMVFDSSEAISNHKLVYSSVTISGQTRI